MQYNDMLFNTCMRLKQLFYIMNLFSDIKSKSIVFCLNFIAAHHYNIQGCKVSEKY